MSDDKIYTTDFTDAYSLKGSFVEEEKEVKTCNDEDHPKQGRRTITGSLFIFHSSTSLRSPTFFTDLGVDVMWNLTIKLELNISFNPDFFFALEILA